MSLEITPSEKVPDDRTCPDMKERAKYFLNVQYLGRSYFIPLTKEMKKLWGIHLTGGQIDSKLTSLKQQALIEEIIRDTIASLYLQIRDMVGSEIHRDLSTQIKDGLERMFEERLGAITDKLDQKLLPPVSQTEGKL